MSKSQITLRKQGLPFTQIPNSLLCDSTLSSTAKTLWSFLQSRPDNWVFFWEEILSNFKEGRDSVKKASKELENRGYLKKEQKRVILGNTGKTIYGGMEITLFYEPVHLSNIKNQNQVAESQITENQSSENQVTENQSTYKYSKNKYLSNKDLKNFSFLQKGPEKENVYHGQVFLKEKKEKFKKPSLEEVINIFGSQKLLSSPERYYLFRDRENWEGVKNLMSDILWWEQGYKNKYPELHSNQKKIALSPEEIAKRESERKKYEKVLSNIKLLMSDSQDDLYKYFVSSPIEETDTGYKVTVQSPHIAIKYKELLEKINVSIEVADTSITQNS